MNKMDASSSGSWLLTREIAVGGLRPRGDGGGQELVVLVLANGSRQAERRGMKS